MNDFWKKNSFPNLLVVLVLSIVLLWGAVGHISAFYYKTRYNKSQSELGQLRAELESATDNQRQLTEQIDTVRTITGECIDFVGREREILLTGGNTIAEIRASVQDLEEYCDRLELYIYSISNNIDNRTNNTE